MWVEVQAVRQGAGGAGAWLQVDVESALQGGVDLDRGHPPLLVGTAEEVFGVLRVDLPEAPFARLVLLPGDFDEALVERQVVSDGVLKHTRCSE